MTIADVAANYVDAESYRQLVKQWARTTLEEMEALDFKKRGFHDPDSTR